MTWCGLKWKSHAMGFEMHNNQEVWGQNRNSDSLGYFTVFKWPLKNHWRNNSFILDIQKSLEKYGFVVPNPLKKNLWVIVKLCTNSLALQECGELQSNCSSHYKVDGDTIQAIQRKCSYIIKLASLLLTIMDATTHSFYWVKWWTIKVAPSCFHYFKCI